MARLSRRTLLAGAAGAVLTPALSRGQSWPSGTIRIVAPFPAGGTVDAFSRLVQPGLQQRLGVTVIVENRPGAMGSTGTAAAAKAPPDGNTWVVVFDTHAVNPTLIPNMPFDTEKDLDPVLLVGTAPHIFCCHHTRPYRSLKDVMDAAKAKPDTLTYASIGNGSLGHLTGVLLSKRAGIRMVHVPYRGGGPALNDAVAGHVDMIMASAALVSPQIQAGSLRALVQTGAVRLPQYPNLPTVIESGFPGFESYAWWGVFAPGGTPKAIVDRFRDELVASIREERVIKQLTENQQMTLRLGGANELRAFVREQMKIWGDVVRENNIKAEI